MSQAPLSRTSDLTFPWGTLSDDGIDELTTDRRPTPSEEAGCSEQPHDPRSANLP